MLIPLRVVCLPGVVLVEGGVEVEEVREEAAGAYLAGELVEVVVRVLGQIADSAFLLPDLDREDSCRAVSYAFIRGVEDFTDDATAFGGSVGTIVDGAEHDLVAAAAVDGIHIVYEGLHCLVNPADGLVDGMLESTLGALQAGKVALDVIINFGGLELGVVGVHHCRHFVDFFLKSLADVRSEIEVEGGDGLAAVHFVLDRLHGDTGQNRGSLDSLCRTGLSVAGFQAVFENHVEGMLDAGKGLGRIVVLVVDVDIVSGHCIADIGGEKALVNVALGSLGGEFHHHAGGSVGVHVGVLAGDVVHLGVDDSLENFVSVGLTGEIPLVAVGDILLGHLLAGALHQLHLDAVLNLLDAHSVDVDLGDCICNLGGEDDVLSVIRYVHCLEDGGNDFLVIEFDNATVAFYNVLHHDWLSFSFD